MMKLKLWMLYWFLGSFAYCVQHNDAEYFATGQAKL